jgi:hypothetical protein
MHRDADGGQRARATLDTMEHVRRTHNRPTVLGLSTGWRPGMLPAGQPERLRKSLRGARFRRSDPVAQLVEQRTFNP